MTRNNVAKTYTDETGKFAKGSPGRRPGGDPRQLSLLLRTDHFGAFASSLALGPVRCRGSSQRSFPGRSLSPDNQFPAPFL